jgi:iron complex transport system ATP-binding protein
MQPTEPFFVCSGVSAAYDGAQVLRDVDLSVAPGEMLGVIGPNGSGKSTLLRVLSGALTPAAGRTTLAGRDVQRMRARERARLVGMVGQQTNLTFSFAVWDLVAMGRHAHLAPLSGLTEHDREVVRWALERTDCLHLRQRLVTELSGGEVQRVTIARALAQEPRALLLDEPTSQLDLNHQLEIGGLLRDLNRERGITIVWVSHELNLAAEFCERIVMVADGGVVADGVPAQVITEELLGQLYGVAVPVIENPLSGRPHVLLSACKREAGRC